MDPTESNAVGLFILAFAWLILGWVIWVPLAMVFGWDVEPVAAGGFVALLGAAVVLFVVERPERRRRRKEMLDGLNRPTNEE
ncbi:MAG: hypothetical protein PSX37_02705 [bacterium]|nr:hypothetical protein [bacterium]